LALRASADVERAEEDLRHPIPAARRSDCVAKNHQSDGKTSDVRRIILTVQGDLPFMEESGGIDQMLSAILGIFIVLSIGILAAHALEAFRSD
jgi:hypothetical protein